MYTLDITVFSFIMPLTFIMLFIRWKSTKLSPSVAYKYRKIRFNKYRIFKMFLFMQLISVLFHLGSKQCTNIDHIFVVIYPLITIYIVCVYAYCYPPKLEEIEINQKDYEDFEKSFIRDRKLKKLI